VAIHYHEVYCQNKIIREELLLEWFYKSNQSSLSSGKVRNLSISGATVKQHLQMIVLAAIQIDGKVLRNHVVVRKQDDQVDFKFHFELWG